MYEVHEDMNREHPFSLPRYTRVPISSIRLQRTLAAQTRQDLVSPHLLKQSHHLSLNTSNECSGKKLNLDSIKSHSSIHSTPRDGYMVGAEYGLGCTKYAAARNVSQSITRFFQTFQWEYQIHTLCFQRIKKNYDFLVYNKTCVSLSIIKKIAVSIVQSILYLDK